ncbi:MAG: 4Fe-4S dicluster domain-containing protein [Chloroflexi bacterium]|nr:4Fe-4S dicluster domain-containing protein [Chloroflexota bacterium]MBP7045761.1 4Fe-4S dicluster domain-containing protein [Chloroflexota bacterium]
MLTNSPPVLTNPPKNFLETVKQATPGDSRLTMCIQCGTCGGSCPSGQDMDHTPRQLFAMIRADMRDEVLRSNTPWYCVSCYFCMVRCPQEVHIADIMYTLKSMAIAADVYETNSAADLSQNFVGYVENYGRSFEFGLATRQYLRHQPLSLMRRASMGLGMLSKKRIDLTPSRIENLGQLQAILARAKELEAPT